MEVEDACSGVQNVEVAGVHAGHPHLTMMSLQLSTAEAGRRVQQEVECSSHHFHADQDQTCALRSPDVVHFQGLNVLRYLDEVHYLNADQGREMKGQRRLEVQGSMLTAQTAQVGRNISEAALHLQPPQPQVTSDAVLVALASGVGLAALNVDLVVLNVDPGPMADVELVQAADVLVLVEDSHVVIANRCPLICVCQRLSCRPLFVPSVSLSHPNVIHLGMDHYRHHVRHARNEVEANSQAAQANRASARFDATPGSISVACRVAEPSSVFNKPRDRTGHIMVEG